MGHHDASGRKLCPRCATHKDQADFNPSKVNWDGLQSYCRECSSWQVMWTRHRLRREQYEELLAGQEGGCAICGITQCESGNRFSIDHDHSCCPGERSCGECIRGLLCSACNRMISNARDSVETLKAGIAYLACRSSSPIAAK
jgi:hypothetical protein